MQTCNATGYCNALYLALFQQPIVPKKKKNKRQNLRFKLWFILNVTAPGY